MELLKLREILQDNTKLYFPKLTNPDIIASSLFQHLYKIRIFGLRQVVPLLEFYPHQSTQLNR
jgi:hypothetical protein